MQPDALWRRLFARRRAYRAVFRDPVHGAVVLADLARFCHAIKTTHVPGDTHGTAQLEGRRQVWLRLQETLRLSDEQLEDIRRHAAQQEDDLA